MDYDRGRVKKVRRKDTDADAPADGNRFQAAWSQRGEPGSSLGPVARTSSSSGAYSIIAEFIRQLCLHQFIIHPGLLKVV